MTETSRLLRGGAPVPCASVAAPATSEGGSSIFSCVIEGVVEPPSDGRVTADLDVDHAPDRPVVLLAELPPEQAAKRSMAAISPPTTCGRTFAWPPERIPCRTEAPPGPNTCGNDEAVT